MPETTKLLIVCAWHTKYFGHPLIMGVKDGKGETGESHSICPKCQALFDKELAEYEEAKHD